MVEIRHIQSGRVLIEIDVETLSGANLAGEYLIHADLCGMNLSSSMLLFANLSGANLAYTDLSHAKLRGANLTEANLRGANLAGADLNGATLSLTDLSECANLHLAHGLQTIDHRNPSELGEITLRASIAKLPDIFLRGAGYTATEIRHLRERFAED